MKRNILIAIIALIFTSGSIGYYIYNRPQKDMQAAKADIAIDAGQLFSEFETDETAANADDPVLNAIELAERRKTLIAERTTRNGKTVYTFNIVVQGDNETVFFDL